jgi:hypothetical protein
MVIYLRDRLQEEMDQYLETTHYRDLNMDIAERICIMEIMNDYDIINLYKQFKDSKNAGKNF